LIASSGYRFDAGEPTKGILYFLTDIVPGPQNSVKVIYLAGYTATTLPNDLRRVILRQAAHWLKQNKNFSKYEAQGDMIQEFTMLAANQRYRRKFIYED
jgi:hypothetical protein